MCEHIAEPGRAALLTWYAPMTGVNSSDPNVSTAAHITRAALTPSSGVRPDGSGTVEITCLLSFTQPWNPGEPCQFLRLK
jgi:hypothetical protein